jgi:hypothetical protein
MRPIIVGLWSRDTTVHSGSSTPDKVKHLKEAAARVTAAVTAAKVPDRQDVRGILIAPEYFFTKPGAGGWGGGKFNDRSLSKADLEAAVREFEAISKLNPKVLLIPGTVAWKKPLLRPPEEARKFSSLTGDRSGPLKTGTRLEGARKDLTHEKDKTGDKMGGQRLGSRVMRDKIFNFLCANWPWAVANESYFKDNWGAPLSDTNKLITAFLHDDTLLEFVEPDATLRAKEVSTIPRLSEKAAALGTATSMMRNTAFALLNGRVRFKYNKQGDFHEAIGDGAQTVYIPGAKAGVATIGAIRFGFEICLDHALGYLSRAGATNPIASGLAREPRDIHIVTSASVENKTANMYVRPGGYFLHASQNPGWTCVYHNKPSGGLEPVTARIEKGTLDGDPFELVRIELPNFGLSGV